MPKLPAPKKSPSGHVAAEAGIRWLERRFDEDVFSHRYNHVRSNPVPRRGSLLPPQQDRCRRILNNCWCRGYSGSKLCDTPARDAGQKNKP